MGEFLTVEQVAEEEGVKPATIRTWLVAGKLVGRKLGAKKSQWRVDREDLELWRRQQKNS